MAQAFNTIPVEENPEASPKKKKKKDSTPQKVALPGMDEEDDE